MPPQKQKHVFSSSLDAYFRTSRSTRRVLYTLCVAYFLFMVGVNSLMFVRGRSLALREAYARRTASATLGAAALAETFEKVKDVAVGFATRARIQEHVANGQWDEAAIALNSALKDFPYVDRVFFTDPSGVLRSDIPALPNVRGLDFSWRDWYAGVSKNWEPYISEAYKRAGAPQLNVVATAVPIKSSSGSIMGILVMQIKLDSLLGWTHDVSLGASTNIYIVDEHGHVAAHTMRNPQDDIADVSTMPEVKNVLNGMSGANISYDERRQKDFIIAYAPVVNYGWGVLVEQPASIALERYYYDMINNVILQLSIFTFGLLTLGVLAVLARQLILLRQREKACLESVGDALIGIDKHWNIILWNRAAEDMIGWKEDEVLGKPFRSVITILRKRDYKPHESFIADAIYSKQVQSPRGGTIVLRQDGEEIVVNAVASPIIDDEHVVVGCILDFRKAKKKG